MSYLLTGEGPVDPSAHNLTCEGPVDPSARWRGAAKYDIIIIASVVGLAAATKSVRMVKWLHGSEQFWSKLGGASLKKKRADLFGSQMGLLHKLAKGILQV